MPLIRVELLVGTSIERRRQLAAALADAAANHLGARREVVRILFREFAPADIAVGGVLRESSSRETGVTPPDHAQEPQE